MQIYVYIVPDAVLKNTVC